MSVCTTTKGTSRKSGVALSAFGGGNQSAADLKTFFESNLMYSNAINSPTAYGNLTLNGQNCGPFDCVLKRGDITLTSTPTSSDWFTTTKDTRSAIIGVAGNLTLNSNVFIRPPDRKLFMAIYVQGNLTINSGATISMTARGANHSGAGSSGGATTARAIRLATGTFGGVSNPEVPAAGGAGGSTDTVTYAQENTRSVGNAATAGSGGGSGGGGGGAGGFPGGAGTNTYGGGSSGTCFTSGSGGGGIYNNGGGTVASGTGASNGGAGGHSWINAVGFGGPGAGNPAGVYGGTGPWGNALYSSSSWPTWRQTGDGGTTSGHASMGFPHDSAWTSGSGNMRGRQAAFEGYANGTAGTLIVYVYGTLSGSGYIDSSGLDGGVDGGGGSGGGSITVFYNKDSSSITPRAPGQKGGPWNSSHGGMGGTGTARKLSGL